MLKSSEIIQLPEFQLLSEQNKKDYQENGFLLIKSLFSKEETQKLRSIAEKDIPQTEILVKGDQSGNITKLKMWDRPGDDIYGMFSRNERIVDNVEVLFAEPIYIYSAKMILKNAKEGGAWEWHQDYGYWYNYGCLLPTMNSCIIAIDAANKENGCLQVLRGSHKIGRINHDRINDQTVADNEKIQEAIKKFELEYIEMQPGDALIFDGNLLHRSDSNQSEHDRWSFIASYNTVANKPYKRVREYGNYEELVKVPRSAVAEFSL
ncbi:phytanoyl-CoA dioxygenase family protein [Pedobacter frigiditerrae]|uniref:Phytanoyl-CoA dioxygenase family protein n=1 Tax=Pedobacter frigiditerrae TaxID=2530452 RepID=A0A4R0MPE7_9SPHI|nr:phytanoyl-CoA dioxygenase family protein [Pedobacter frigiditerrae]TCC88708.1 phytanoyl-CoA dioxygenase family protein [Pedobacter frigiditerrae]